MPLKLIAILFQDRVRHIIDVFLLSFEQDIRQLELNSAPDVTQPNSLLRFLFLARVEEGTAGERALLHTVAAGIPLNASTIVLHLCEDSVSREQLMECIVLPVVSLIVLFVNGDRADIVAQV